MITKSFMWLYLISALISALILLGIIAIIISNSVGLTNIRIFAMPLVISMAVMLTSKIIGSQLTQRSGHG